MSVDWTSGYVADIGYTYGYYNELNPLRAKFALSLAAHVPPENMTTACELGYGQGLSVNIHAASSDLQWFGTDFNPTQASFARDLASGSGIGSNLYDDAFADFAKRSELPDFDYIGLHGIWSWISPENRQVIVDFLRRKLKIGGVLYVSYNTQPGWAAMLPMRDLLTQHANVMGVAGQGIVSRIGASLEFAERLFAVNPLYAKQNPQVQERIKRMKDQNRNYLAHEYFNRDWHPMGFSQMADILSAAKLQYACSAHFADHVDAINLTADQQKFLNEIPDPMFREQVRDFVVNQQFRRDYWIKGSRRPTPLERLEAIRAQRFVLQQPRADIQLKITGMLGEANLNEGVYTPVIDLMADHKVRSLGQIEQALPAINFNQLLQTITILMAKGCFAPAQEDSCIARARKNSHRLNRILTQKSRSTGDLGTLASPVTGGGIIVPRFHQLFLDGTSRGLKTGTELATDLWQLLERQGQRLIKDGKPLNEVDENRKELSRQADEFVSKYLPCYRALNLI